MSEKFRTCLFGGFAKDDVVRFISQQTEADNEKINSLTEEVEALRRENAQLEEALRTLHSKTSELQESNRCADEMSETIHRLEEKLAAASAEAERLRGPAKAYQDVKEHIADIEISAHRRTEEFRAQAIAKLRECIQQQRDWCNEQKGRYAGMNEDTLQTLRRCQQLVENNASAAFDTMLSRLQELEDTIE